MIRLTISQSSHLAIAASAITNAPMKKPAPNASRYSYHISTLLHLHVVEILAEEIPSPSVEGIERLPMRPELLPRLAIGAVHPVFEQIQVYRQPLAMK
jgi:hypothetical protein